MFDSRRDHPHTPFILPVDPRAKHGDLRILQHAWDDLIGHLLGDGDEHAAMLLCGQNETEGSITFLVREVVPLRPEDYLDRSALHLSVAPTTLARIAKRARLINASLIMVHSHPFPGRVAPSQLDLQTEADLCRRVLPTRTGKPAAALVVGPNGVDGRIWTAAGAGAFTHIRVIGDVAEQLAVSSTGLAGWDDDRRAEKVETGAIAEETATARQELLWGSEGQRALRNAHAVVVGCGGTGSHVATQLAHLRVGRLTLIDDDAVETSNLSRIVGLGPEDTGRSKVDALGDRLRRIHPDCTIGTVKASVLDIDPDRLTTADVIICATDGHGSRSLLNEIAFQYYVPVVDLGVEVVPGSSFRAGGGVRVLRPGRGCLWCAQTLSSALVREEYLSVHERQLEAGRGYLRSQHEPTPSVVALNGVVASLAVMEVCQLLVGMLGSGRDRLLYRSEQRALSTAALLAQPSCHVCGDAGVVGRGDAERVKSRWRKQSSRGA